MKKIIILISIIGLTGCYVDKYKVLDHKYQRALHYANTHKIKSGNFFYIGDSMIIEKRNYKW